MSIQGKIKRLKKSLYALRRNYFKYGLDFLTNVTIKSIHEEINELQAMGVCQDAKIPLTVYCTYKTHKYSWERFVTDFEIKY